MVSVKSIGPGRAKKRTINHHKIGSFLLKGAFKKEENANYKADDFKL
jgi:hypothetical protein